VLRIAVRAFLSSAVEIMTFEARYSHSSPALAPRTTFPRKLLGATGGPPTCFGEPATLVGTDGDDELKGTDGADVIVGRDGNDDILGRGGIDRVCAGPNTVILTQGGDDALRGGSGRVRNVGGNGSDLCRSPRTGSRALACER
jgi:hypothetical protein